MITTSTVAATRARVKEYHAAGETIGLVTTMGALHEGHLTLMRAARDNHDRVMATIFVNPTQFGQMADLATYPSDDKRDLRMLTDEGVDCVFLPKAPTIYPAGDETIVEATRMSNMLHGKVRPGHFRGVTTVVARLFNIVQPDAAYFGEKDYQQLQIIKKMVRDLHMPLTIHGVSTVREDDGLAMSSRNVRLGAQDRKAATVLHKSLMAAEAAATKGTTVEDMWSVIADMITAEPRATLKAVDIVQAESLDPVSGPLTGPTAIMISAEFGDVLLIDQHVVTP